MSKSSRRAFNAMRKKIEESKKIAKRESAKMCYNSKPLDMTCSVPSSNIIWGTTK